mmetsp:Transcript_55242/g.165532  ORF Transcript_55242/g.165532 Transcript_55242/m.165532 type:complete len:246 (-) Transcript_55242:137-874(-)
MPALRGRKLDEIEVLVQNVERRGVVPHRHRIGFLRLFSVHGLLDGVHLLEERLGRLHRGKIVRSLLLIDPEGVPQQIHGGLHVVVSRIPNLLPPAVPVLLGALPVDVLPLRLDDDDSEGVEEFANVRVGHVPPDHELSEVEEFVHALLDSAVVPPLGDGNGRVLPGGGAAARECLPGRNPDRGGRQGGRDEKVSAVLPRRIVDVGLLLAGAQCGGIGGGAGADAAAGREEGRGGGEGRRGGGREG